MKNLVGHFRSLNNILYRVNIIADSSTTEAEEILLSAVNPFTVQYQTSQTPFDPIRNSTVEINVVNNNYMLDSISPNPLEVQVILTNEDTGEVEWKGFLLPDSITNQGYENCYETITLKASDVISHLYFLNYEILGEKKTIVSVKDIIMSVIERTNNIISGFYFARSKKVGTRILLPEHLFISEQNFFTSDTDEGWNLQEVLEEICRYLGFTLVQKGDKLYFLDYQYLTDHDDFLLTPYLRTNNYEPGTAIHQGNLYQVTRESYRENGAQLSLVIPYDKFVVRDNYYIPDKLIPDFFDDDNLINISGDNFWDSTAYQPRHTSVDPNYRYATWYNKKESSRKEETPDYNTTYVGRGFLHKYYDFHKVWGGNSSIITATDMNHIPHHGDVWKTCGIWDYAQVDNPDTEKPHDPSFSRYLILCTPGEDNKETPNQYTAPYQDSWADIYDASGMEYPLLSLKDEATLPIIFPDNCYIVFGANTIFERYMGRCWQNSEWTSERGYDGGTIRQPGIRFRIGIGDKWWNGSTWSTEKNAQTSLVAYCTYDIDQDGNSTGNNFNKNLHIANTNNWRYYTGKAGYTIPITSTDNLQGDIHFELLTPVRIADQFGYVWMDNIELSIVEQYAGVREDKDVYHSNIISSSSFNTYSDITCRLTTHAYNGNLSYSDVGYSTGGSITMLSAVTEDSISGVAQKPEENIIEKYSQQYSTNTLQLNLTIENKIDALTKIYAAYVDEPNKKFAVLGEEIDYNMGRTRINIIELK